MNLRTKILLFVAACIAVFCALVVALAHFILLPAADRGEALVMVQNLRRFEDRLRTRLTQLSDSGLDWACWDETGDLIANRNRAFEKEVLDAHSFKENNLDLVVLWDPRDRQVIGRMLRWPAVKPVEVPVDFLAELAAVPGVFQRAPEGELLGLTRTSQGVLLLSARAVLNTKGEGPVRGTILVGRFLEGARLDELQAHEPFAVKVLPPSSLPSGLGAALASDGARAAFAASETVLLGRAPLTDLNGATAAIVELRGPRSLHLQQVRSIRLVLGVLGAGSVILVVLVGWLVEVLFLRRLFRLQKEVRELKDEAGIARLEATDGTPEFRTLGRNIATMARGLRAAQVQAEAASRAKGAFLATMSHEIRTPMNGVLGFTSLLKGTALTAEQTEYVATIEQSGEMLLALINDILDLSRLEAGRLELERQPVVLADLVSEVSVLFSPRLQAKRVALAIDVADDVPPLVLADALRLRQVLFNLVGNAAKFTRQGEVRLTLERVGDGPETSTKECVVRFEVADTGIGLTPEQSARLFQPFSQADSTTTRQYGGTGLGLAISQRLVEAMGGKIGMVSKPDHGARFYFSVQLPVVETPPVDPEGGAGHTQTATPRFAGRVLVVEDNSVNRRMIAMMLHRLGCTADYAENGREAVAKATALTPGYDLVLMDVVMPEMDGLDATRSIRSHESAGRLRPAWIVALTASAMADDRERCQAVGMNDFLAKPIRLGELIAALERIPRPGRNT